MTATEPIKLRTWHLRDGNLVPAYYQSYKFNNKSEMLFFARSKEKDSDVLEVYWFELKRGERGNKKPKFYVSVYTPRNDNQ